MIKKAAKATKEMFKITVKAMKTSIKAFQFIKLQVKANKTGLNPRS
jgi:hypothetical protein